MRVLFVCTGNIFRSVSAEFLFNEHVRLLKLSDMQASSAGTIALPQPFFPVTIHALQKYGLNVSGHKQTKFTNEHFKAFDIVVAMAVSHVDFIKQHFHKDVVLYNEIAVGKKMSVEDVNEAVPDWILHPRQSMAHVEKTIDYLHDTMPDFVKNLKTFVPNV